MLSTGPVSAHTALPSCQIKQAPLGRGETECTESRIMKLHPCTARSLFLKLTSEKKRFALFTVCPVENCGKALGVFPC